MNLTNVSVTLHEQYNKYYSPNAPLTSSQRLYIYMEIGEVGNKRKKERKEKERKGKQNNFRSVVPLLSP